MPADSATQYALVALHLPNLRSSSLRNFRDLPFEKIHLRMQSKRSERNRINAPQNKRYINHGEYFNNCASQDNDAPHSISEQSDLPKGSG
jgi:hypothetical protein